MRDLRRVSLSVFLAALLASLLGFATSGGDAGDDALAAFTSNDFVRAFQLAGPAAQKNNFLAQFILGNIYKGGRGAPQNKTEAEKWFRQALSHARPAAQNGEPRAQYVIGQLNQEGWVLPKNYLQAVVWYRKAAEQGFALAQFSLGVMYQWGLGGVTRDDKEALVWFRKAAEQGNANAQVSLGWVYQQGLGVAKDDKEALAWYRKAAQQGSAVAQNNIGFMYQGGLGGVTKDDKEAVIWYRKAAKQDYARAQSNLGNMYQQGLGVPKDDKEAVAWYRKAAEQGDAAAQYSLGWMYQWGLGVPDDDKEAVAWYRKAAEQGDARAQGKLKELAEVVKAEGIGSEGKVVGIPISALPFLFPTMAFAFVLALTIWYWGIHKWRPSSRWLNGLRFTLWIWVIGGLGSGKMWDSLVLNISSAVRQRQTPEQGVQKLIEFARANPKATANQMDQKRDEVLKTLAPVVYIRSVAPVAEGFTTCFVFWLLSFFVLFPFGVWKGRRKS